MGQVRSRAVQPERSRRDSPSARSREPAPASGSDGARVRARWAPRGRPHDRSTRQPGADVGRAARVAGGGTRRPGRVLRAVGRAGAAGDQVGLPGAEGAGLRRAGLVHNIGRLGVSNSIWDKSGPLGAGEWERVRMHPYFTERMLQQSGALAPLGRIAVQHCERMDGSGYPRGLPGNAISRPARILGAANAYQAMREPRAHRAPRSGPDAAAELRAEARAGRLDADAVESVLTVAGHRVPRRREGPAGLTAREFEVLKLLGQGLSNKRIAQRLVISPKTAGNHIEHIYTKIDASNRAMASAFAMQHGLLPEEELISSPAP